MTYVSFAVIGFAVGAVFVVLGLALLVTYRALGIINFSQAAFGMWGVYVYERLRTTGDLVLPAGRVHFHSPLGVTAALLVAAATSAVLGFLSYWLVFRILRTAPILAQVVASVALMLSVEALVVVRFGPNGVSTPSILPTGDVKIGSSTFSSTGLLMAAAAIGLAVLTAVFLHRTTWGIGIRGSASNERAIALMGLSPNLLGTLSIVCSAVAVTVIGCLAAPSTGVDATTYALYVVDGLAVLLLAKMSSVRIICIAGLALGAFQGIVLDLISHPWWPQWAQTGLSDAVPFILIVATLFVLGKRLPSRGRLTVGALPDVQPPKLGLVRTAIGTGVCLVFLFVLHGLYRYGLITSMCVAILALSYTVITGYLGQISLAQMSFAGASGFTLSKLGEVSGIPFPVAVAIASIFGAALGTIMAVPALRIRGAQLAVVTLAGGVAIQEFVFENTSLTKSDGNPVSGPSLFGLDLSIRRGTDIARVQFGVVVLIILVVLLLLLGRLFRGETGRSWLAVRANERSAAAAGIDVRMTKFIGFALSGLIAGLAGCLISYSRGEMSSTSFTIDMGLSVLAFVYIGGISSIAGALIAGLLAPLGLVYEILQAHINFGQYYALIGGLGLIVAAVSNPVGIAGKTAEQWATLMSRRKSPGNRRESRRAALPEEDLQSV